MDLPLRRDESDGAVRFVVAADSHVGMTMADGSMLDEDDLYYALLQATDYPNLDFFTIVGDLTDNSDAREFAAVTESLRQVPVHFVPVSGNHDWADGGQTYRQHFGPPMYSFDVRGVHVVVLAHDLSSAEQAAFLRMDAEHTASQFEVVVLTHAPPSEVVLEALSEIGADYLFSGHWHSNRFIEHDGFVELNTEPLVRGAIDLVPSGFRVVTIGDAGVEIEHGTVVQRPIIALVYPARGTCVPPGMVDVIASVDLGGSRPQVFASLNGGPADALRSLGGWAFGGPIGDLPAGEHALKLTVVRESTVLMDRQFEICVSQTAQSSLETAEWPQMQGGPERAGRAEYTVVPALTTLWARTLGGHAHGGSAVIANGTVFVSVVDFAAGSHGGVVALDLLTGVEKWRYQTGVSVRNAPMVADGLVVVASSDSVVHAVDVNTGLRVWAYDLAEGQSPDVSAMYGTPVAAEGIVYAGTPRHFAALDALTGVPIWTADPAGMDTWLAFYSSASVGDGVVIQFTRGAPGVAWDAYTGQVLWTVEGSYSSRVQSTPSISAGAVYWGDGHARAHAYDLRSGKEIWTALLYDDATPREFVLAGTFAVDEKAIYVPTTRGDLIALDRGCGAELWRRRVGDPAAITVGHTSRENSGLVAAPVVTGDVIWVGGNDGILRALSARSGTPIWSMDLGAPVLQAAAPAGDILVVATFDGVVRGLIHDSSVPVPVPDETDGCSCGTSHAGGGMGWILFAAWLAGRRRKRASGVRLVRRARRLGSGWANT